MEYPFKTENKNFYNQAEDLIKFNYRYPFYFEKSPKDFKDNCEYNLENGILNETNLLPWEKTNTIDIYDSSIQI